MTFAEAPEARIRPARASTIAPRATPQMCGLVDRVKWSLLLAGDFPNAGGVPGSGPPEGDSGGSECPRLPSEVTSSNISITQVINMFEVVTKAGFCAQGSARGGKTRQRMFDREARMAKSQP